MKLFEILFIALGLSLDAFAVSAASGATMKRLHLPNALKMGLFFGGFQALMPVLGWAAGGFILIAIGLKILIGHLGFLN